MTVNKNARQNYWPVPMNQFRPEYFGDKETFKKIWAEEIPP